MNAVITAFGGFVPPTVIDNKKVAAWTGKSAAWIQDRTGILERRYASADTPTSALAYHAVMDLTARFPGALDDVATILVATSTPDRPQPPTAARLQSMLNLSGIPAYDLNAVCAGWLYGLRVAEALTKTQPGNVLLVGADKYSTILNKKDPTTATLFGDGAGATVIARGDKPGAGLLSLLLATHGEYADLVTVPAGGSENPSPYDPRESLFRMQGRDVKEYVLKHLPATLSDACSAAGVGLADLGAIISHQANVRLLQELADRLGVDPARVPLTAPRWGNTAAASLPLTLLAAYDSGLLVPGRPVGLCAVGGGLSVAAGIYVP
jgi:3-oxoacyl-[acyl-carrier-protein] synthase-3